MYEKILLPTDGSDGMERVAEKAVKLAECHSSEIHIIYVVDTRSYALLPDDSQGNIRTSVAEAGSDILEDFASLPIFDGITVETVIAEGIPHEVITQYALEEEMDGIIMGTHGRTGPERQALGSVAERVVRFAPIPVTVIPLFESEDEEPHIRGFQ